MTIAIIIITVLLSVQFVAAIEKDCMSLAVMFGVEIILFAYIMSNCQFWKKRLTNSAKYAILIM